MLTTHVNVLVTGGNGFIGRRVCRKAVSDGHAVTSVARSGPPTLSGNEPWINDVNWCQADVFAPNDWRDAVADADSVVHSIGTLSESPKAGVTLERLNGDSAILAALEAERTGTDRFVYVSSAAKPPFVRDAYLDARRRAERAIVDLDMTVAMPRFGPVYGPNQPHFPSAVNRLFALLGRFEPIAKRFGDDRPFAVEQAAAITYRLAVDETVPTGPLGATELATLS